MLPAELVYEVYGVNGQPLTTVVYKLERSEAKQSDLFTAFAYAMTDEAIVVDKRGLMPIASRYLLRTGDSPPFFDDGGPTVRRLTEERLSHDGARASYRRKRDGSVLAMFLSAGFWIWVYMDRRRAQQQQQQMV